MGYTLGFLRKCELDYNLLTVPKFFLVRSVKMLEDQLYCLLGPNVGPKYVSLITPELILLQP